MNDQTSHYVNATLDPTEKRIRGVAVHGNTEFDAPYISEITPNLWVGGCADGLVLPTNIEYVVSLYPWERYTAHHDVKGVLSLRLYDADLAGVSLLVQTAELVNVFRKLGPTLVHCQAGLNRSNLVVGLALVLGTPSVPPRDAIHLLREKRSPAVLCNPKFERFLIEESEALRRAA